MKKGKMKSKTKNNSSNRLVYFLVTLGILILVGVGVYALTPGVAPNPGHLISEMAPPSPCTAGQNLQFDGTNWVCATPSPPAPQIVSNYCPNSPYCSVTCPSGKHIIGGGCTTGEHPMLINYPASSTIWSCGSGQSGAETAYALCV